MSQAYIYDYIPIVSPDNDVRLTVPSQVEIPEIYELNQEIHRFDDGSESVITFDTNEIIHVDLVFPNKPVANIGTVLNDFLSASIGHGVAESFLWEHPEDEFTYVVKFRDRITRIVRPWNEAIPKVKLKIMGKLLSLVQEQYRWLLSGNGTGEYYCVSAAGVDPSLAEPTRCWINRGTAVSEGSMGSLSVNEYDYGDNDALGYSTIYARIVGDPHPDAQTNGYIEVDV